MIVALAMYDIYVSVGMDYAILFWGVLWCSKCKEMKLLPVVLQLRSTYPYASCRLRQRWPPRNCAPRKRLYQMDVDTDDDYE